MINKDKQLKIGVLLNYTIIFMTTIIGLFLTPIMIKHLGDSEYGLYTLIGAFVGYLTVMDFGLNNTIVRFISRYQAEKNSRDEELFLSTVMIVYIFICSLIIVLSTLMYLNFENIFSSSLNTEELEKAKLMFIILVLNIVITLPGGSFKAISNSYEHFVFPRIAEIVKYLSRSILVVVILLNGSDALGIVILDTVANVSLVVINAIYVSKILKVKFKIHSFNKELTKKVFTYSIWIFIFSIVGIFQWQLGQFLVGVYMNTTNVAIYAIGVMLGTYYGTFSTAISSVMMPKASKMIINNSSSLEQTDMMIKVGKYSLLVLFLILGNFILFGKEFIHLWVGELYIKSWFIALLIMVVYTIPLIQSFANTILEVKALFKFKALTYIISIGLGAILGVYLLEEFGLEGMIIGTSIGWVFGIIIMNIYYKVKLELGIGRFYLNLFIKPLIIFIVLILIGDTINSNYVELSWISFIVKIFLFSLIYVILNYMLILSNDDKNKIKKLIKVGK